MLDYFFIRDIVKELLGFTMESVALPGAPPLHRSGAPDNPLENKMNDYSESDLMNLIKLEASKKGYHLWRNNSGATYTKDGYFLRYGLANESSTMNKLVKSCDLIGIKPIVITQEMVGKTVGQFFCREVKHAEWRFTGTAREIAQKNFIDWVKKMGGDADFVNKTGTL